MYFLKKLFSRISVIYDFCLYYLEFNVIFGDLENKKLEIC